MIDEKTDKISISMPGSLLAALDRVCGEEHEDRSGYLRRLIVSDLRSRGRMPQGNDPRQRLLALVDAAIEADRADEALLLLAPLATRT